MFVFEPDIMQLLMFIFNFKIIFFLFIFFRNSSPNLLVNILKSISKKNFLIKSLESFSKIHVQNSCMPKIVCKKSRLIKNIFECYERFWMNWKNGNGKRMKKYSFHFEIYCINTPMDKLAWTLQFWSNFNFFSNFFFFRWDYLM